MVTKARCETGQARALNTYVKLMRATESVTARAHRHLSSIGLSFISGPFISFLQVRFYYLLFKECFTAQK